MALITTDALPETSRKSRAELASEVRHSTNSHTCAEQVRQFHTQLEADLEAEAQTLESGLNTYARQLTALDDYLRNAEAERSESAAEEHAMARDIQQRVGDIRQAVKATPEQDRSRTVESHLARIVGSVRDFSNRHNERIAAAVSEIDELRNRLEEAEAETTRLRHELVEEKTRSTVDELTGLANRRSYEGRFAEEIARQLRHRRDLSLIMLDLDHFKAINDEHGHLAGDRVLRTIAERLSTTLRVNDFIARYGGEEFVILLPETGIGEARRVADKLRQTISAEPIAVEDVSLPVTLSAGVTEVQRGDRIEDAFSRADQGLYDAKRGGRNRVSARLR